MRKKVVITGGAGFIGSHLAQRLVQKSYHLTIIDDFNDFYDPAIKKKNIASIARNPLVRVVKEDITHAAAMRTLFKKLQPTHVVHLAARAGVRPSLQNPTLYAHVNILGTLSILEAMKGVRIENFVFGSSSSVYGNSPNVPFSEDDLCDNMISPYAVTKRAAELLCKLHATNESVPTTCLRFFTVYGPRQRPDLAIHSFMKKISAGEPLSMFGDGSSARDYTYIDDIVDGIVRALKKPLPFEIINLGNSHPILLTDTIAAIEKALGKKAAIKKAPFQKGDVVRTFANISKAKKLLDWQPHTGFKEGIMKMAQWYNDTYAKTN